MTCPAVIPPLDLPSFSPPLFPSPPRCLFLCFPPFLVSYAFSFPHSFSYVVCSRVFLLFSFLFSVLSFFPYFTISWFFCFSYLLFLPPWLFPFYHSFPSIPSAFPLSSLSPSLPFQFLSRYSISLLILTPSSFSLLVPHFTLFSALFPCSLCFIFLLSLPFSSLLPSSLTLMYIKVYQLNNYKISDIFLRHYLFHIHTFKYIYIDTYIYIYITTKFYTNDNEIMIK